ncbi:GNAT family N-acetyltransferase [Sanguibacter sp. 25GB23B1]|uniref:GNAT family N-acetyltransferase n=1 Tax=unclassified Sanguibacter TaxID=2645534 RepID=UPI0032AFD38D
MTRARVSAPPTRLVTLADAAPLAALLTRNREFLAPWEPVRPDAYFTERGQALVLGAVLEQHANGTCMPRVVLDEAGEVVGRITLDGIVHGAFQSCNVGYWVSEHANGRGLATAAVGDAVRVAFDELGLHRVQGVTLLHNGASQRVLQRNGFVRIGTAPEYIEIAGRWQDHAMYQVIRSSVGATHGLADRFHPDFTRS